MGKDEKYINNPNSELFGDDLTIKELVLPEVKGLKYDSTIKDVLKEFQNQNAEMVNIFIFIFLTFVLKFLFRKITINLSRYLFQE